MKKILKLTLILFLVSAIVAGILGVVNLVTYERIEEQQRIKTEKAYAAVLASEGYEEVTFDKEAFPTIDLINKCTGGEGYVVTTTFSGAQGSITMAVGVDNDYKCTGISKMGGTIDALTGATITSRSIANATGTAIKAVESLG